MRAALDGEGRLVAPAEWVVARGRTVSLATARGRGDVVDALLLPGLVNAHAHLDLAASPPLPAAGTFPDWLTAVGRARQSAADETLAARDLADFLGRRGVVAVGDVDARMGRATRGLRAASVAGRSYLEIVGVGAASCRARLSQALDAIDRLGHGSEGMGLSPHAPYSVNASVLPEIVRAASARRLPLAMHLAESVEETRYLLHGDGPFVAFLESIGRGRPFARPPGLRPLAYADAAGFLAAGGTVIHGNDLDDEDVARLARHKSPVVYCHGTHRHFDRPAHRLLDLDAAGVPVAIGTDSSASNDGVDLHREACRIAADRPDVPPLFLLRAATLSGWRALRLDEGAATFRQGSWAHGLLLARPPDAATGRTLASWAFSGDALPSYTLHRGRARAGGEPVAGVPAPWLDSSEAPR